MHAIFPASLIFTVFAAFLTLDVCYADTGVHQGRKIFVWPAKNTAKDVETRLKLLGEQIKQYSTLAGSMRTARRGVSDPFWDWRKGRFREIRRKTCPCVQKVLVDTMLEPSMNGYYQYGNCGEGSMVTICLAKHYGFSRKDILHCQNRYKSAQPGKPPRIKHQFGVLRVGNEWYLLDRWNKFQGGLKLTPILKNGRHATAEHDSNRKLYLLTTPKGGSFFAGANVSEEIEARSPPYW